MAVMPEANYKPINYSGVPRISRWDIFCIHTIVGYAPASAAHFSCHSTGQLDQSRDTIYQSAANLNGNYRIIACENEDHGPEYGNWNTNDGHAVPGFTDAQCEGIAKLLAWAYKTHGIPLVLVPDSKPTSRGVAYHRQGIDGNWSGYAYGGRVSGGEKWSNATGKVCPGDRRITQLINVILPRARVLAGLDAPMPWKDEASGVPIPGQANTYHPNGAIQYYDNLYTNQLMWALYGHKHSSAIDPGASGWTHPGALSQLATVLDSLGDLADRMTAMEGKIDQINSKLDQQQQIALEQVEQAAKDGTLQGLAEGTVDVEVTIAGQVIPAEAENKR